MLALPAQRFIQSLHSHCTKTHNTTHCKQKRDGAHIRKHKELTPKTTTKNYILNHQKLYIPHPPTNYTNTIIYRYVRKDIS